MLVIFMYVAWLLIFVKISLKPCVYYDTLFGGFSLLAHSNVLYSLYFLDVTKAISIIMLSCHLALWAWIQFDFVGYVKNKSSGTFWGNLKDIYLDVINQIKYIFPQTINLKDIDHVQNFIEHFTESLSVFNANKIKTDFQNGNYSATVFIECLIKDNPSLITTISDSYYIYMYCKYVRNRSALREYITESKYAYLYCKDIENDKRVRKNITEAKWAYAFCTNIKDDPDVREWFLCVPDFKRRYEINNIRIN